MSHGKRIAAIGLGVLFALAHTPGRIAAQDPPDGNAETDPRAGMVTSLSGLLQIVRRGGAEDVDREAQNSASIPEPERPVVLAPATGIDTSALESDAFTFVRIVYSDGRPGQQGSPWRVDFPDAEESFTKALAEHTNLEVNPKSVILSLNDPALSRYPFIYLVEGGALALRDDEVVALRDYLLGGGFLMVDDFWGDDQWAALAAQLGRVFPDREPIELWPEHEIFFSYYSVSERPGVPGIASVLNPNSAENPDDAVYRGLLDDDGRLMAIFLHNMDFGDAWEHADDPKYPKEVSWGEAIPMGINIVVYALTR